MSVYSSHLPPPDPAHPERAPVLVREGFCWWALPFGWLVLVRPQAWLVALLALTATLLLQGLARAVAGLWVLIPVLHLALALFAYDWRRWELRLAGYVSGPVVAGAGQDAALLRLLELKPGLVGPAERLPA